MITYTKSPADTELLRIMKDFYNLTGIKICIYDTEYTVYEIPQKKPHPSSPDTGNPDMVIQNTEEPYTENDELSSTNVFNTNKSNTYISVTEVTEPTYTQEEMEGWSEDDFYSHLTRKQYDAFIELFHKSVAGEIRSSKESLFVFFKKMMAGGWRDARGKPIKNIVGYVTTIFNAMTRETESSENQREEDILPVYDTSENPPFDEEEFNRIMEEIRKEKK